VPISSLSPTTLVTLSASQPAAKNLTRILPLSLFFVPALATGRRPVPALKAVPAPGHGPIRYDGAPPPAPRLLLLLLLLRPS